MAKGEVKEFRNILNLHAERYPKMEPADLLKLIYQNEFGPAHLQVDTEESLASIREEFQGIEEEEDFEGTLYEDIGNGYVRLNFQAVDPLDYPAEAINEDFIASVGVKTGKPQRFLQKVDWALAHFQEFPFHFTEDDLEDAFRRYLDTVKDGKLRPIRHSKTYREAYQPSYRVILKERMRDFAEERDKENGTGIRVMKRIIWILVFLVILALLIIAGKAGYKFFVLK